MSKVKNNHFVSRFLTEPWEVADRNLFYFDFSTQATKLRTSKFVFAKKRIISSEADRRFNGLIETPLGSAFSEIRKGREPNFDDMKTARAVYLYFLAQIPRLAQAHKPGTKDLEDLLSMSDAKLNLLLLISTSESQAFVAPIEPGKRLYFPEVGVFSFPVKDPGCVSHWSWGFGVPVSLTRALLLISKTASPKDVKDIPLAEISVGLGEPCKKVVLPPGVEKFSPEEIASIVNEHRTLCKELVATVDEYRMTIRRHIEESGNVLEKIPGFFHNKVRIKTKIAV
jgi:hypothetical protein